MKIGRSVFLIGAALWSMTVVSQARLILNDGGWVRIDNGAWVVIGNTTPTGIQTTGTGGNIWSEGEFNRVRWNIRNSTGSYVVPFTTANGVRMPLTCAVTTAGDNGTNASIAFSTYNYGTIGATNWNNNLYRPSDVTHMNNLSTSTNNSDRVVDRFWIIDASASGYAYATKPSVTLGFTYDPGSATGEIRPSNAITAATVVGAQRFNPGTSTWGDMPAQGTFAAGAVNSVSSAVIPSTAFFRSWTLADLANPLPVELARFTGNCAGDGVSLEWTTGSELANSHFLVQRSVDGEAFETIGRVEGMGFSQSATEYSFSDKEPPPLSYYRLLQVDFDGTTSPGPVVPVQCQVYENTEIVSAWDDGLGVQVMIVVPNDHQRSLELYDASGKRVWSSRMAFAAGTNTMRIPAADLAPGIYLIRSEGGGRVLVRRVAVQ